MGGGSQYPFGHPGSQDATIPEPYGVDPSIAPGLSRPQGWRVALPDGTGAWDKVGPLDTDWQLVGSGAPGDVTGLAAGDAGIILTNAGGPVVTVGQRAAAEEDRIYAVDFVNGLDSNAGYAVLPPAANAAQYAAACVAAGLVAKKTIGGSALIRPPTGNDHIAELVIANGGVNTIQAYTEDVGLWVNGCTGYRSLNVRGTGTNTTAGAVAFAGTTNDVDYVGGITCTGCNAPGYNPVAAFSTSIIKCLQVGGGAAAIPAEPAAPLGWRIRFDNATTTAALRNINRQIFQVAGTDTVSLQSVLPAVPVGTDVFYLEMAGITIPASTIGGAGLTAAGVSPRFIGIRSTGTWTAKDMSGRFAFCAANLFTSPSGGLNANTFTQTYTHPILGVRTVGGGMRCETSCLLSATSLQTCAGLVVVTTLTIFQTTTFVAIANGCSAEAVLIQGTIQPAGTTATTQPTFGLASGALGTPRVRGLNGLRVITSYCQLGASVHENAGATPAIKVEGHSVVAFAGAAVSGTVGNTDVGMDLTLARGSLIIVTTTPTVTGALGDVRLAGGQIVTWAQAVATGIADSAGNRIIGTAGTPPVAITKFSGTVVGAVGAVVSYMADTGPIAANQIVPLRYPTSFRLATRLRFTNLVNTSANAVTVTLYKNGVATAMQVTIPAGTAANTKFSDVVRPILFLDGDDFDLRFDDAADVGGVVTGTAALEWAA